MPLVTECQNRVPAATRVSQAASRSDGRIAAPAGDAKLGRLAQLGEVRPVAAAQAVMAARDHRRGRPGPRSRTGRGMSG